MGFWFARADYIVSILPSWGDDFIECVLWAGSLSPSSLLTVSWIEALTASSGYERNKCSFEARCRSGLGDVVPEVRQKWKSINLSVGAQVSLFPLHLI